MTVKFKFDPKAAVARAIGDRTHAESNGLSLDPWCPRCGAPECHPTEKSILIRGYKVDTASECLVCASADEGATGGYDENLKWHSPFKRSDSGIGWFDDGGDAAALIIVLL